MSSFYEQIRGKVIRGESVYDEHTPIKAYSLPPNFSLNNDEPNQEPFVRYQSQIILNESNFDYDDDFDVGEGVGESVSKCVGEGEGVDVDVNELIMSQRKNEIKSIEEECLALNEIIKDLAIMTNDQTETIETAAQNVENTVEHIEEGVQHLEQADELNSNSIKKKLTWTGVLGSVGTIVGGCVLSAFHPFIGVPIIVVGIGGLGTTIKFGKVV